MSSSVLSGEMIPLSIAVLTVSDTRDRETDRSGPLLVSLLCGAGHRLFAHGIVRDSQAEITAQVREWIAPGTGVHAVIATGGTGLTGRDVTPEAFKSLYDQEIPGFGELFRWLSHGRIGPSTIQSRATAGIAGGVYLFALPGSPGACRDAWEQILSHQLDSRTKPCNMVEMIGRLQERQDGSGGSSPPCPGMPAR